MQRGQGNRHFQMSKAIFMDMKGGSTDGYRERFVGVLSQAPIAIAAARLLRLSLLLRFIGSAQCRIGCEAARRQQ